METSSNEKTLKKMAFGLGILQGLAYAVLAAICIAFYNQELRDIKINSYMDIANSNMYYLFLAPSDLISFDYTLRPAVFSGFAWVYLLIHLSWVGISVEGLRRGRGVTQPKYLTAWSHLTLFICLWDFITVVILGTDYAKCMSWVDTTNYDKIESKAECAIGILPVLVIAAKGFVLWVINLVFSIILLKMSLKLKKRTVYPQILGSPPIGLQQYRPDAPQNIFIQPHQPTPYATQNSVNVNSNQNHFDFPAHILKLDYHHKINKQQIRQEDIIKCRL